MNDMDGIDPTPEELAEFAKDMVVTGRPLPDGCAQYGITGAIFTDEKCEICFSDGGRVVFHHKL
jgi:hypothetical protein